MSCCSPHKKSSDASSSCCAPPSRSASAPTPTVITRHMTIEEILGLFPYKAQRLSQEITQAGLQCIGCHAAVWETLEAGMYSHGKSEEEINRLVDRLNALLQEPNDLSNIRLTARAASKFLDILVEEKKVGWGMRFSEEMAGCNGFEYVLDFSEAAQPDDVIFASHGVEVHIKQSMLPRLLGSEIDYVEGLRGAGFKISNPNVRSSCGCGSSHNY